MIIIETKQSSQLMVIYCCPLETICEFDAMSIKCSEDTLLNITSAFWGRNEGEEKCISNYYKDSNTRTSQCIQPPSEAQSLLKNLQYNCNKKEKCEFQLLKWRLGDPCQKIQVSKYLEITYDCIKKRE